MTTTRAARHANPRRSPWRPLAVAAVGASVLAIAGQGVWAGLTASATNTSAQSVGSGGLTLTMAANGAGFSTAVTGLAPGDTVNRHVTLTNAGTVAGGGLSFGVSSPSANLLTDATKGLQIKVSSCAVAWVATAGTCSGGAGTVVMTSRAISTLIAGATPTLTGLATTAGTSNYLQISLTLPEQDEVTTNGAAPATSIQDKTAALTYTFTAAQRAAQTTNS